MAFEFFSQQFQDCAISLQGKPQEDPQKKSQEKLQARFPAIGKRVMAAIVTTLTLALNLPMAAVAADPFRSSNPSQIGDKTEAAFEAWFKEGNYTEADRLLQNAEPEEPLAYALKAARAHLDQRWQVMAENTQATLQTAEKLKVTDPLRGHLYTAVGHFLEGAYTLATQNTVAATPTVLAKLQQVFTSLKEAEKINPNDPELNLIKGYMDLMLAVNLPFSNPNQAIQRLESNAAPTYLVHRGVAIAYRDLNQQDQALSAVEAALKLAPNNPEVVYLKAQILKRQGDQLTGQAQKQKFEESLALFRQAVTKADQLPRDTAREINREGCQLLQEIQGKNPRVCRGEARELQSWRSTATNPASSPATTNRHSNQPANQSANRRPTGQPRSQSSGQSVNQATSPATTQPAAPSGTPTRSTPTTP